MTDTRKLLQLKESKDSLSAFKAILDEETRNYKNAISLFEKDIISKNELKSKENLYRKAKSEYDNREAIYKRILWEFDNLNVKAPFDGYINKFYFDEGQKILAGQKSGYYIQAREPAPGRKSNRKIQSGAPPIESTAA